MRVPFLVLVYAASILAVLLFGTFGTYYFSHNNGFNTKTSLLSSLYFTVVTLSTVGYGDIVPVSSAAKVFVIILIIVGLSIFLTAVTLLSSEIMNSRIKKLSGEISYLESKLSKADVILIGTDFTNIALAEILKKEGKKYLLITSDKSKADKLNKQGLKTFVADETSKSDLSKFNFKNSKLAVVDFKEGSKIIYTVLIITSISPKLKIIVIAPDTEVEAHLINLRMNIEVINPAALTAIQIGKYL